MTIQLTPRTAATFGKSKATLQAALNETPFQVAFDEPSFFSERGQFNATSIAKPEKFTVVMDPAKRSRFATVERRADGTFKVS